MVSNSIIVQKLGYALSASDVMAFDGEVGGPVATVTKH
jgi:hypothetical protein